MLTPCSSGSTNIFCVCGIAVRAAGDVFVINRCPGVTRNVFAFRSCIDDILDVMKIDELNYKACILRFSIHPSPIYFSALHGVGKLPIQLKHQIFNQLMHVS